MNSDQKNYRPILSADISWCQLLRFNKMRWLYFWSTHGSNLHLHGKKRFQLILLKNSWVRQLKMANLATSPKFLGAFCRSQFWMRESKIWGRWVSWFISCGHGTVSHQLEISADVLQKWREILWSKFADVSCYLSTNFHPILFSGFGCSHFSPYKRITL